jgi:hypothetical protein
MSGGIVRVAVGPRLCVGQADQPVMRTVIGPALTQAGG